MRKNFTQLALMLLAVLSFSTAFAGSGGPDAYGYTWLDSNEPNGPSYVWNDITGAAGAVQIMGLADDNAVGPYNLGWSFQYYWTGQDKFKFGSNGWIGLGDDGNIGNIAHCFPTVPSPGGSGDNFLAPFMSDLNFNGATNPGEAWYWSNNTDTLIIQWNNVPWWANAVPDFVGSNTFQVILSGVDSSITFMYNDMDQAAFNDTQNCAADLEIGMENVTGNIGLEVMNEMVPSDQLAVKFYYPGTVTFQVPDATPAWNANNANAGQLFISGSNVDMMTNIANVGNADITNDITVDGELQALNFSTVWSDQATIAGGLTAGMNQTVTFPMQASLAAAGQFYYNVSSSSAQDINPSNNDNTVEISVVECNNDTLNMTYATGNAPDGAIAWSGGSGDDGCAVYFEPPAYPMTLESVDMFIVGDNDPNTPMTVGYTVMIYDDSGVPGTVLDSVFIPAGSVIEGNWNRTALSSAVTIASGGFYVSWIMEGDGIALGTEAFGPISQRTYEILGGSWAPYRQVTVEDFLVSVHTSGCGSFVGVEDPASNLNLETYPNPTANAFKVRFDLPSAGTVSFNMMDMYGKTIFRQSTEANAGTSTFTYDASELANGVYFLNMQSNGQNVTRRVVVAH